MRADPRRFDDPARHCRSASSPRPRRRAAATRRCRAPPIASPGRPRTGSSTLRSALRDLTAPMTESDAARRLVAIAAACRGSPRSPTSGSSSTASAASSTSAFASPSTSSTAGFYDLLASEARATSLWAIAKGDVPAAHWVALGRPFFAVGELAGLRSWSGSMFEYLMPTLVLDEPYGSAPAQRRACRGPGAHRVRARASRALGNLGVRLRGSDHTLAYQYAPQGVPRLALRRTPDQRARHRALRDRAGGAGRAAPRRIEPAPARGARARGRYGFIESLDYYAGRASRAAKASPASSTFMAHHQGMSIVAIANVLLDGARAPLGHGRRADRGGRLAAARARAARGAAAARAAGEPRHRAR